MYPQIIKLATCTRSFENKIFTCKEKQFASVTKIHNSRNNVYLLFRAVSPACSKLENSLLAPYNLQLDIIIRLVASSL